MTSSRPVLRPPCALPQDASALEAARWMKVRHSCAVVVTEHGRPVGLVSDRDLVTKLLAKGRDPARATLAELCESPVVTMDEGEPPAVAAQRMREYAVRWLVVVEADGRPVGILTIEDLFARFARDLGQLARAVERLRDPEALPRPAARPKPKEREQGAE